MYSAQLWAPMALYGLIKCFDSYPWPSSYFHSPTGFSNLQFSNLQIDKAALTEYPSNPFRLFIATLNMTAFIG